VTVATRSGSAEQTRLAGAALAAVLRPGDVVLLVGELGAGKTTMVQGMAAGLGVREHVTSPTFTLVRPYDCATPGSEENPGAVRVLLHADLYRLERTGELADLALGELVEEGAAAVVEWGEVADAPLRRGALVVRLDVDDAEAEVRHLTVELPAERGRDADQLRAGLTTPPAGD
jgi:tRNA threonylcarbamoyladenosine biosynthesis protein TsaE